MASGMRSQNFASREKKSFGYKEQCPVKRATYKASLAEALEEGLSPI